MASMVVSRQLGFLATHAAIVAGVPRSCSAASASAKISGPTKAGTALGTGAAEPVASSTSPPSWGNEHIKLVGKGRSSNQRIGNPSTSATISGTGGVTHGTYVTGAGVVSAN